MNSSLEDRTQIYRIPIRPQYKRRRRPKKRNNFPKFLLLLALIVFGIYHLIDNQVKTDFKPKTVNTNHHTALDLPFNFSPKRQNILLLGVDATNSNPENPFKGNRSDTMLLISIAPYGKNINVISVPRDSKVYLAGKNRTDKINHAFA